MISMPISAVIIDDEQDSINLLEMYLRHFPFVTVTGTQTDAKKGLKLVVENSPELVFLDIDMPDMNGLQVADHIQSENIYSEIVFTTAHPHYAYDSLGIEPLDFLTKPFCMDDLEIVMQKYEAKAEKKKHEQKLGKFIHSQSNAPKIKLPTIHGFLILEQKDIVVLKSEAKGSKIYLQDGSVEWSTSKISIIANQLNSLTFLKSDRATYINLNYLQRVDKKNQKCILNFNHQLHEEPISRNQMIFFEKMNLFSEI